MRASCICFLLAWLTVAGAALGQESGTGIPKFAVDVQLVNVGFSVRDRAGELVRGLVEEDLRVFEDNTQQDVKYFGSERDTPLTIGILLDIGSSQKGFEDENAYVAKSFFQRILREQDQAFIVAFGNRIQEICGFTNSIEQLERGLRGRDFLYNNSRRLGPAVHRRRGSAVVDALYWAAKERLADLGGRKALIMIGDGREISSQMNLDDSIEALQRSDSIFYSLNNGGSQPGADETLPSCLPMIAKETGGREFKLGEITLQEAFDQIEAELRAFYTLSYQSTNSQRDGRFRKIEIRPIDRDLKVRARPGYYAK